jgi:uncharacterized protein YhfF
MEIPIPRRCLIKMEMTLAEERLIIDNVRAALAARGTPLPSGYVSIDHFGDSPELSAELLALIASGKKRGGASLHAAYAIEKLPVPQAGEIRIVLDFTDKPVFVTRNTAVDIIPFNAVGADFAACEGEGDGSLAYWRAAHLDYFTRSSPELGITFNEDMLIVCERFEVLHILS